MPALDIQKHKALLPALVKSAPLKASAVAKSARFIELLQAIRVEVPQRKIINAPVLQKLQIDLILAAACAGLSMERHKVHTAIHMRQSLVNFFSVLTEYHTRNGRVLIAVSSPAVSEQLQIFRKFPVTKRACRLVVVPGQIQIVDLRRSSDGSKQRVDRARTHPRPVKQISCDQNRAHRALLRKLCQPDKALQHFRIPHRCLLRRQTGCRRTEAVPRR